MSSLLAWVYGHSRQRHVSQGAQHRREPVAPARGARARRPQLDNLCLCDGPLHSCLVLVLCVLPVLLVVPAPCAVSSFLLPLRVCFVCCLRLLCLFALCCLLPLCLCLFSSHSVFIFSLEKPLRSQTNGNLSDCPRGSLGCRPASLSSLDGVQIFVTNFWPSSGASANPRIPAPTNVSIQMTPSEALESHQQAWLWRCLAPTQLSTHNEHCR